MTAPALAPPRRVLALALLGLVGCGLFATLNPMPVLGVDGIEPHIGRVVRFQAVAASVAVTEDRLSGRLFVEVPHAATGAPSASAGAAASSPARAIEFGFVWFDASEDALAGFLPGDGIEGMARLEGRDDRLQLVLDGPFAARVSEGPRPVPALWDELVAAPSRYTDRFVRLHAVAYEDRLGSPDGEHWCPRVIDEHTSARVDAHGPQVLIVVIVQDAAAPRWGCRIVGSENPPYVNTPAAPSPAGVGRER